MKLTLKQKREIVRRFWAGESLSSIHVPILDAETPMDQYDDILEAVLRSYLRGEFSLEPKKRLSPDGVLKSVERMPLAERKYFVDRYNGLVPKRRKR